MAYSWRSPRITPEEEERIEQDMAIQEIKEALATQELSRPTDEKRCCGGKCGG